MDNNKIIFGDITTPFSSMDRSSRQKIIKETLDLNMSDKIDLTDIYRTFHAKAKYTHSSQVHMQHFSA